MSSTWGEPLTMAARVLSGTGDSIVEAMGASAPHVVIRAAQWAEEGIRACDDIVLPFSMPRSLFLWSVAMCTFHTPALFLQSLDYFRLLQSYKAAPSSKAGRVTYLEALPAVLWNQVFLWLPSLLLVEYLGLAFADTPRGMTLANAVLSLAWMSLGHEIIFYAGHRWLLHSQWGLRVLGHRVHHAADATCGITAMYMSPVDFILEIVLPHIVPLVIVAPFVDGLAMNATFMVLGSLGGVYEHSGYNFWPNISWLDTTAHLEHHRKYNVSFADGVGSPSILDVLFGTVHNAGSAAAKDSHPHVAFAFSFALLSAGFYALVTLLYLHFQHGGLVQE